MSLRKKSRSGVKSAEISRDILRRKACVSRTVCSAASGAVIRSTSVTGLLFPSLRLRRSGDESFYGRRAKVEQSIAEISAPGSTARSRKLIMAESISASSIRVRLRQRRRK